MTPLAVDRAVDASDGRATLGPIVVLRASGSAFAALIEPPLTDGDHRVCFPDKDAAWGAARDLWTAFRLGFQDETEGSTGRWKDNRK